MFEKDRITDSSKNRITDSSFEEMNRRLLEAGKVFEKKQSTNFNCKKPPPTIKKNRITDSSFEEMNRRLLEAGKYI